MDEMREIGGYMEMEPLCGASVLHKEEIALNSGRNALVWLYMLRRDSGKPIRKLRIPYYLCGSVASVCKQYGIPYSYYNIDDHFEPIVADDLAEDEWLYIVNYYGQHSNKKISNWKLQYGNIVVDNAQSYYQEPVSNVDTIYTCRKFFGVPDGAFLHVADDLKVELQPEKLYPLEQATSYDHMRFLFGRFERTANEFYSEFRDNEERICKDPVMGMSKLTENLLRGIDYDAVREQRETNWYYMEQEFGIGKINRLHPTMPQGPFMYPLWITGGAELRKYLQARKIYVPTLWPDVLERCKPESLEYQLAADLLPLPIDQRYGMDEMKIVADAVREGI